MSPVNKYKKLENSAVEHAGNFFGKIGKAIGGFFSGIINKGKQKFTIMPVPHSEEKIVNFQISFSALIFFGVIIFSILSAFFLLSTTLSGTTKQLAIEQENREKIQHDIEVLRTQIDEVLKASSRFTKTFAAVIESIGIDNNQGSAPEKGKGDLSSFFVLEDIEDGPLTELSKLQNLKKTLNSAVEPLENINNLLGAQKELLADIPNIWPVQNGLGRITNPFGFAENPFRAETYLHKGIDIATGTYGTPLIATANGKVVKAEHDPAGYGNHIMIRHKYGFYTLFGHMQSLILQKGQKVVQGQVIGYIGNSGLSTGPHVHYEVHIGTQVVDPEKYLHIKGMTGQ